MWVAFAGRDPAPIVSASRYPIALGFGFTRWRDEFLVACLGGLRRSQSPWPVQTLDWGREVVWLDLATRTNRVGAGLMRYAPGSSLAEVHVRVALVMLATSHPSVVQFAIISLPAKGRAFGTATVLGLLTCHVPLVCNPVLGPRRARDDASSTFGLSVAIRG
jgi:hypothetical protein